MSLSEQKIHAAGQEFQGWNFEVPPAGLRGAKMQLLTIGKISVTGQWYGGLGQYFVAWAPLLKIPKVTNGFRTRKDGCTN